MGHSQKPQKTALQGALEAFLKAWRVVHWNTFHETAESRKIVRLWYYAQPNKHDGMGYRLMANQANREALLAGWTLVLQTASKGPPRQRGWLIRNGQALSATDLALMTGFPQETFDMTFNFFSQGAVNWLKNEEYPDLPGQSPVKAGDTPDLPGQSPGAPLRNERRGEEIKGDQKGEKKGGGVAASRTRWAALSQQIKELEARGDELSDDDRQNLKKKRAELSQLREQQARGQF